MDICYNFNSSMGPVIWEENNAIDNIFDGIRTLSKYLMWAGFIFLIIKFGKDIMTKLNQDKDIDLV